MQRKQWFIIAGALFITSQLYLYFFYRHFEHFPQISTISNLTSLMVPFEHLERNATFSCSELTLQSRYKLEFQQLEHYDLNQSYKQPPMSIRSKQQNQTDLPQLPYFYSLWKTASILPRLITPCEHQVYINLLKTFDQICRQGGVEYMISYGTLLGSYRNHDILPYDDDVDVLIHVKYYSLLAKINKLNNKTDWEFYRNTRTNMKFYFLESPSAGIYKWKWPFIGMDFYTDNATHIRSYMHIRKDIIFPLVLRPIAGLWVPGPRNIYKFFQVMSSRYYSSFSIDEKCYTQAYSHREERRKHQQKTVFCEQLRNIYPYIRRTCDSDYCQEHLMLNNVTTLYVLKMIRDK
ncbi:unnamed protein product [Rotaria socialis]|uniref:LicD/FKTN/FKRP nucleotidyltransferase domain-containing protein n=2 Tax=Rotaria socialis TaxID=392032 RepID=A0A817L8M4_9BILA|nr:unnamed protein product [Rotaria socialis]CAF4144514.1 unnamed protein product [Rotaria socialis]